VNPQLQTTQADEISDELITAVADVLRPSQQLEVSDTGFQVGREGSMAQRDTRQWKESWLMLQR
jgi:hypothetical protein